MNPIEKALAQADDITAANQDLERISRDYARTRRAAIAGKDPEVVARYLPDNYRVAGMALIAGTWPVVLIEGTDSHGWTLDDYVLPRLASGLLFGRELKDSELR